MSARSRAPLFGEEERLVALRELRILDTPSEERFDRVTRLCQRLFGVPMAFVNLIDRDRQFTKSAQGLAVSDVPREDSLCAAAITGPEDLVVTDLRADARFAGNPFVTELPRLRFYAGVPLAAPGGARVGTLCICDTEPRELSTADLMLLRDLALWVEKELNLDEELARAAEVQRAMLPFVAPHSDRWELAGACRPSRAVGGDFFDWFSSPSGLVLTVGDVMGKGMPAAILMATVRAAVRMAAGAADLGAGMNGAAASLAADLAATDAFATVVQARLGADGAVELVDAGHGLAAVVAADGSVRETQERGLPLGIDVGERYRCERFELAVGEALLVVSDGLLEPSGAPTLPEAAAAVRSRATAQLAVDRLFELVPATAPDDVTVVVARRRA